MKVAHALTALAVVLAGTGCEQPQTQTQQPEATFAIGDQPSVFDGYGLEEAELARVCEDDAFFLAKRAVADDIYLGSPASVRADVIEIPPYRMRRDSGVLSLYSNISVSGAAATPILAIAEEIDGVQEPPWRSEEGNGFSRMAHGGSSFSIRNDKIRKILSAILFATNGREFQEVTLDEFVAGSEGSRYADTTRMIGAPVRVAEWYIPQVRLNDNDAKLDLAGNLHVAVAQDRNDTVFLRLTGGEASVLAVIDPRRMAGLHYVCAN